MENTIHIGLLGCSKIAPFSILNPVKEIVGVDVCGIASSSFERAKKYADQHKIKKVYESYDAILKDEHVDVVYIPLANPQHKEWTIQALKHKKHVLVEKPITLYAEEVKEIEKTASENHVHVLEALMVQHHPWQKELKDIIGSQKYGKLKKIKTRISFEIMGGKFEADNYRFQPENGGGCFIDESSYWLQFIQYMVGLHPSDYKGSSKFDGVNGCDWNFDAFLTYADGVQAEFNASFDRASNATHWLEFENGEIKIHNFFKPCYGKYKIKFNIQDHQTGEHSIMEFLPENYYVNQMKFFVDVIQGKAENISLKESFERIDMMRKIYHSVKETLNLEVGTK
ncbi:Gfo/Idh/MocA family protein [Paenibacillus etheri]|uniref:Uncharacterized protein n=1 Tax=Paenibacillus etheri TaxID=1306852 RepID=A0A0W1AZ64_9BACL|nr:Gfo/Idh/MocA family oxidoreductase [Paenibacillus etheri]KTD86636.1 hypothetical protein UQ64_14355 [Paenibacillus etheri]